MSDYKDGYPEGKTAEQLGMRIGDRCEVIVNTSAGSVGETLELVEMDGTECPKFKNLDAGNIGVYATLFKLKPSDKLFKGDVCKVVDASCHLSAKTVVVDAVRESGFVSFHLKDGSAKCYEPPRSVMRLRGEPTEPQTKFKVGDKVHVRCCHDEDDEEGSEVFTIERIEVGDDYPYILDRAACCEDYYDDDDLVLATEASQSSQRIRPDVPSAHLTVSSWTAPKIFFDEYPINKEKSFMTTVKEKIKVLAMDADTKALYKAGFIDVNGNLTSEGEEAMHQVQFESLKSGLVDVAKKLNDEDKEDKKAGK